MSRFGPLGSSGGPLTYIRSADVYTSCARKHVVMVALEDLRRISSVPLVEIGRSSRRNYARQPPDRPW